MRSQVDFVIDDATVRCTGNWTAPNLHEIEQRLSQTDWPAASIQFDVSAIAKLDTVGAWLLRRTISALEAAGKDSGRLIKIEGADEHARQLLALVGGKSEGAEHPPKPYLPGTLENVGRHAWGQLQQYLDFLNFIGKLALVSGPAVMRPWRIRWMQVVKELQAAGVNALPIVGLLTFLIGIVIAYQGGIVLRDYGANIYIADIVGLSMVRELAPLITAIIVAGRTGSAYTAQIGTMMVTEEVDALRSLGIAPLEMLVLPKLIALLIALPLLTVFSDVMGLFGGMVMAKSMLSLNPATFLARLADALTLKSYISGVGKAPVFAAIIAAVGCFQGFRVFGSAASVGRRTTVSVVQSIFLVIIVDAAFSMAFSKLGI
jgi:phospholipid/cholesterol/gamma-HCH transport system permease protein